MPPNEPIQESPCRCLNCPAFKKILLVQEDSSDGTGLEKALRDGGFQVQTEADWAGVCSKVAELACEFVIWNTHAPGQGELEALRQLRQRCPRLPVIVLVDGAEAETAIGLMKAGAFDYLVKPLEVSALYAALARVIQSRQMLCEALLIPGTTSLRATGPRLVGHSPAIQEVYRRIGLVAERDEPVLIRGETGSGKELVARAIHQHSRRRHEVFLAINCAALSESLLESELFGHEKGAFTGATQRRLGAFETADRGTLFLDEIGDMSLSLQAKILRTLQQGEICRLGASNTLPVDVRLLAATNKDLEKAIREGSFREDLYYRLNVVTIPVPPLREHLEDLLPLVDYFIDRYTPSGEHRPALDTLALRKMQGYSWPGNVRELENTVRRALVTAKGQAIMEKDIVFALPRGDNEEPRPGESAHLVCPEATTPDHSLDQELDLALEKWLSHQAEKKDTGLTMPDRLERKLLLAALNCTGGNQAQAARLLGISRSTLRQWLKKTKT